MATSTSYAVLRQNLMKLLNASRTVTATSAGGASGVSYISTGLKKWDGGNDDYYNGQWLITTSGATQETVFITKYLATSGTITPRPSFSAQIANSVTAEIMPWEPTLILDAFQRAIDGCYPNPQAGRKGLFKTIFEEFVANNWLWNGHFEDWTATTIPDHWVLTGSATVSEETTIIRGPLGTSAMKMTGGGAVSYVEQIQSLNPGLLDLENRTITFYVWAYATVANLAGITVSYKIASSSDFVSKASSYHTGNGEYELLSVEVTLPQDITDIGIRLTSYGGTVYYDNIYLTGAPRLYRYHLSKDFIHDPIAVQYQTNDGDTYGADMLAGGEVWNLLPHGNWHIEDDGTNRMLILQDTTLVDRRKLRVMGNETLTVPTTDASTVEVAGDQMRALVTLAASELMLSLEGSAAMADSAIIDYKGRSAMWRATAEGLLRLYGRPFPMGHVNVRL